jgi:hypothetical protein
MTLVFLNNEFLLNAADSIVGVLSRFVREREKGEKHCCEIGTHSGKVAKEELIIEILNKFN